jgi:hypothetical protein
MLFMGAIATFPLFVPPYLLPLYVTSVGLSSQAAAAIVAAWNLASAVGCIGMGLGADTFLGPVNSMLISPIIIGVTTLALWPFDSSVGLLIFVILNGMGSGRFFSLSPVLVPCPTFLGFASSPPAKLVLLTVPARKSLISL